MRAAAATMILAAATLAAGNAQAQSLASRIARIDGDVRLSFAARPGVCGDGGPTIYMQESGGRRTVHYRGNGNSYSTTSDKYRDEWVEECEVGPVRVALTMQDGSPISVRTYVGGRWRDTGSATDLGQVPAREAANALLSLAERATRKGSEAIFAATLADSSDMGPQLLRMARNQDLPRETRRNVVFWLGQVASEKATANLREIIDSDDDVEVRKQAVFALSQRPADESVPALISVIRKGGDARIVKQALFWLAQKDDPRALTLLEELILSKK